jgi:hypothetical protein
MRLQTLTGGAGVIRIRKRRACEINQWSFPGYRIEKTMRQKSQELTNTVNSAIRFASLRREGRKDCQQHDKSNPARPAARNADTPSIKYAFSSFARKESATMFGPPWYIYLLQFVAGLFLANGVPHFVQGISGHWFQTPFASPPGIGESSPVVNVLWGFLNFVIGFLLLWSFWPKGSPVLAEWAFVGLGVLVIGIFLAWHFGRVRSKRA